MSDILYQVNEFEPMAGVPIGVACKELCRIAAEQNRTCRLTFNDIRLKADPGDDPEQLMLDYWKLKEVKSRA